MNIPIFKLHFDQEFISKYQEGSKLILESGELTNGPYVKKFEEEFKKISKTEYALAVSNGTAALEVSLRALDLRGKKVIIPTNTFIATAVAVENAGAKPLILDIEKDSFSLNPDLLQKTLESEKDVAAVILVHIGGIISPHIEKIISLCNEYKVALIEDAAHAHGATYQGKPSGSFGLSGCFSFFPTKVMTTAEGGMITTSSKDFFEKIQSIRQFGQDMTQTYLHLQNGSNFKMTEFQALLGLLDMQRLNERLNKRTKLAEIYQQELDHSDFELINTDSSSKNAFYKAIILSQIKSDEIRLRCKDKDIELTGEVYRYPLHQQPVYKEKLNALDYPNAQHFSEYHICPPLYPELTEDEVRYICQVLKQI